MSMNCLGKSLQLQSRNYLNTLNFRREVEAGPTFFQRWYFSGLNNPFGDNEVIILRLRKGGAGNLRFRLSIYNNGGWTNDNSTDVIETERWYRIDIKYDNVNNAWEWRIDGVTEGYGTLTGTHYEGIQKWNIGMQNQSRTATVYFDLVRVNALTFY